MQPALLVTIQLQPAPADSCRAYTAQIAVNNEVLVAISNKNYAGPGNMLATWMECVQRVGVTNAMVVALDAETKAHVQAAGMATLEMHMEVPFPEQDLHIAAASSGLQCRASCASPIA